MAIYNPSNHIPLSKAMGATRFPVDGKFMYFTNGENGKYEYRPFVSLAEVKTYFPLGSDFRKGGFEICVNTGGTLSGDGSYITGGINSIYWWANGVLDADLIPKVQGVIIDVQKTNADVDSDGYISYTPPTGKAVIGADILQTISSVSKRKNLFPSYEDGKLYGFEKLTDSDTQNIIIKVG